MGRILWRIWGGIPALATSVALAVLGSGACSGAAVDRPAPPVADDLSSLSTLPPLDYGRPELWGCTSKTGDVCDREYDYDVKLTDGTNVSAHFRPATAPPIDCFYIYPTVDFRFTAENHEDLTDLELPSATIESQASRFSDVCTVYAPYYRQMTIGTYDASVTDAVPIVVNAFADVSAAFEYYLAHWNRGRPIVLIGHSQGAQMTSYLLYRYFDGAKVVSEIDGSRNSDELRARLVAALPIGFNVFTPIGALAGGSFGEIPLCRTDGGDDTPGCVIHYRSYPERFLFGKEAAGGFELDSEMARRGFLFSPYDAGKDRLACVNPSTTPLAAHDRALVSLAPLRVRNNVISNGDTRVMQGTFRIGELRAITAAGGSGSSEAQFPGRYAATCRTDRIAGDFLAISFHEGPETAPTDVRGDPASVEGVVARSALGLHLADFVIPLGDLVEQVRRRSARFLAEHPEIGVRGAPVVPRGSLSSGHPLGGPAPR